ncbi:hypothetical protein J3R82DRAFT_6533 [Butyriboletus roseoflavus]|nr:hypothetical protein J3R82DRAFT_6533 [Butyriboletus roseoflavus]
MGFFTRFEVFRCVHLAQWSTPHAQLISSLALSRNGEFIASASTDGTICLWGTAASRRQHGSKLRHEKHVRSLYYPMGYLVSGGGDVLSLTMCQRYATCSRSHSEIYQCPTSDF